MPRRTFIRKEGVAVPRAELCSVCECTMDAVECCRVFSRRYVNPRGETVGRLDCPFNGTIDTADVDASALNGESFRLRRVAVARASGDWEDRAKAFDKLVRQARETREPMPV